MTVVELACGAPKFGDPERVARIVIQAQIDIRMSIGGAARVRAAEHDCGDSPDARDSFTDAPDDRAGLQFHGCHLAHAYPPTGRKTRG